MANVAAASTLAGGRSRTASVAVALRRAALVAGVVVALVSL
jgi:hypothetical protein